AAALASELLVLVAVRDEDQFLFCVGVAGALLAPFLTWDGASTVTLLAYGWTVLATAIRAVRRRRWSPADMLAVVGCAAYAVFGALQAERPGTGPLAAAAPALLALGCAWTALARGAHSRQARAALAHLLIALVTIGLSAGAVGPVGAPLFAALALAATATVYLVPARGFCAPDLWRASMLLAPAVYLAVALSTFRDALSLGGAAAAAAWAVAATAAAWRTSARRRGPHVAFATLSSALALAIALHEHPAVCAAALAAHATLAVLLLRRVDSRALLGAAVGVLACASLWALGLLRGDAPFESIPFGGAPSLAALLAAVGWWTIAASPEVARLARQARPDARRGETVPARWKLFGLAAAYTFWWWRLELAGAFSPDAATFLLVAYYAAAGVAVVAAGRRVGVAPVRRAGLSVATYAAAKALVQASALAIVGLRVGSYLLAGGFLLFVAYWYRASEEAGDSQRDAGASRGAFRG
ncbi:MAG TPA: hypothetical protein VKA84_12125, partial [Gemmatimonadaceae bacterium]|nr:hypothetical protein [Gemmatimonadaceae bacterium]